MINKNVKNFLIEALDSFKIKICFFEILGVFSHRGVEVLILPLILKSIINNHINNTLTMQKVFLFVGLYAIIFCIRYIINFLFYKQVIFNTFIKFESKMRQNIFDYIIKHSINYFNNTQAGTITNKVENIVNSVKSASTLMFEIFCCFIILFISLFYYIRISITLFIFLCIWSTVFMLYIYLSSKYILKYEKDIIDKNNKISGTINDDFVNILNIKATSKQYIEKYNIKKQGIEILQAKSESVLRKTYSSFFMFILMMILICFMLIYSVVLLKNKIITAGDIIFIGQNTVLSSFLLKRLYKNIIDITIIYPLLFNSLEDIVKPYDIEDKKESKNINVFNGKIEFKNINFSYSK